MQDYGKELFNTHIKNAFGRVYLYTDLLQDIKNEGIFSKIYENIESLKIQYILIRMSTGFLKKSGITFG